MLRGDGQKPLCNRCQPIAAETAASRVSWFEPPLVFHHPSAHRRARCAHRLHVETRPLAARWALFFPSHRAGGAVLSASPMKMETIRSAESKVNGTLGGDGVQALRH